MFTSTYINGATSALPNVFGMSMSMSARGGGRIAAACFATRDACCLARWMNCMRSRFFASAAAWCCCRSRVRVDVARAKGATFVLPRESLTSAFFATMPRRSCASILRSSSRRA